MKNGTLGILRKFLRAQHYAKNSERCRLTGSYPDPALQALTAPWRFVFNTKKQFLKRHFIHPALRARWLTGGAFLIFRRCGVEASCAGASRSAGAAVLEEGFLEAARLELGRAGFGWSEKRRNAIAVARRERWWKRESRPLDGSP